MKKIKLFLGVLSSVVIFANLPSLDQIQDDVNAFLSLDGDKIKVIDIKHEVTSTLVTVMVTYEVLSEAV